MTPRKPVLRLTKAIDAVADVQVSFELESSERQIVAVQVGEKAHLHGDIQQCLESNPQYSAPKGYWSSDNLQELT